MSLRHFDVADYERMDATRLRVEIDQFLIALGYTHDTILSEVAGDVLAFRNGKIDWQQWCRQREAGR